MIQDCLDVFEKEYEKHGIKLILDNYIPKDGRYFLVRMKDRGEWEIEETVDISYNKKEGKLVGVESKNYNLIAAMDYYSQLLSINKCLDGNLKKIHSNQVYAIHFKANSIKFEDGKMDTKSQSSFSNYFETLKNVKSKIENGDSITKKFLTKYLELENEIGEVNKEELAKIQEWIMLKIFELDFPTKGTDYVKIFFLKDNESDEGLKIIFENEMKRYLLTRIYNKNDFNVETEEGILGVSDNNITFNVKKPFLQSNTKKNTTTRLVAFEAAYKEKLLFDYLYALSNKNYYFVAFDYDNGITPYKSSFEANNNSMGPVLRIKKGTEVELQDVYNSSERKIWNKKAIRIENKIPTEDNEKIFKGSFNRTKFKESVDLIFFSNTLTTAELNSLSELRINESIFKKNLQTGLLTIQDFFNKGDERGVYGVFKKMYLRTLSYYVSQGYYFKAINTANIMFSIRNYFSKDEGRGSNLKDMYEKLSRKLENKSDLIIENDEEYFFAVGNMVSYLQNLSKAKSKPTSIINSLTSAKSNGVLRMRLINLYDKYNYSIERNYFRVNQVMKSILEYEPVGKVCRETILLGYLSKSLMFSNKKNETEEE